MSPQSRTQSHTGPLRGFVVSDQPKRLAPVSGQKTGVSEGIKFFRDSCFFRLQNRLGNRIQFSTGHGAPARFTPDLERIKKWLTVLFFAPIP